MGKLHQVKSKFSQSSLEYLLVVAITFMIIVPTTYLFYAYSKESSEEITDAQVIKLGRSIVDTAESIFYSGQGSKTELELNVPDSIQSALIIDGVELVFKIPSSSGFSDIVFFSSVNITTIDSNCIGNICQLPGLASSGIKKVKIEAITRESVRIQTTSEAGSKPETFFFDSSGTLTNGLVAYWKLDEASGERKDAKGNNHLADVKGTVASIPGKIGNAAQFNAADSEYLSILDNADLSLDSDTSFTVAAWVFINSKPVGSGMGIATKWNNGAAGSAEYVIRYPVDEDRLQFIVKGGTINSPASLEIGRWYFIVVWHAATQDSIYVQVNEEVAGPTPHAAGTIDGSWNFNLGSVNDGALNTLFDGLIDEVGLWKRVLSNKEREDLYNNGNGNTLT